MHQPKRDMELWLWGVPSKMSLWCQRCRMPRTWAEAYSHWLLRQLQGHARKNAHSCVASYSQFIRTFLLIQECNVDEMEDFPRRMRDWLFNVMRDLVERDEINDHYKAMELEAETNLTRRWANAAVWKWCDLDLSHDRSVSRHELFPIRAPLMSLEHCIAPFLESCDPNDDHRITLQEWGNCLKLDEVSSNRISVWSWH